MKDEFYAKLSIFSETLTPDKVSSILGLNCDKGYEIGDIVRPHGIVHRKENQWLIYSRVPRNAPLQDHVKDVLGRVAPVMEKIGNIADQPDTEVELGCVIHAIEEPPLFFTREQVAIIFKMGASIDVDLYFWQKDSEEGKEQTNSV
jgi:hypothetical protein